METKRLFALFGPSNLPGYRGIWENHIGKRGVVASAAETSRGESWKALYKQGYRIRPIEIFYDTPLNKGKK